MQKIRKKYRTVKAVGPERTDGRTYVRTDESEFIGSFRSLRTSGEPKNEAIFEKWRKQVRQAMVPRIYNLKY